MKRTAILVLTVIVAGCSSTSSPPTTLGVDKAPQVIKDTYLTVTRQAAALEGYDATNDEWLDFARQVCADGIATTSDLNDFVDQKTGSDSSLRQMWQTATMAATTAFCPIGDE